MSRRRKNYDSKKQKLIADVLEYYKPESIQEVQEALTELLVIIPNSESHPFRQYRATQSIGESQ